jgi:sensory rhodopsin
MAETAVTASYAAGTVGLVIGIGIALKLLQDDTADNDRGKFAWLIIIPGFAAISYLFMTLEIGTVSVGDNEVYLFRYIDWLVTTPILVGYAAYVAGAPRTWILGVGVADALMILTGLGAALTTGLATWVGFAVSGGFHLVLLSILYLVLPRYVPDNRQRYRLFKILQNHVGLLWIAYPVVWLASPAALGYVSVTGTAMIIVFLDVVAKTPYVYFVWKERRCFTDEAFVPDVSESTTAAPSD